jgi:hypothetical protein
VGPYGIFSVTTNSGTYILGAPWPGTFSIYAFYDFRGVMNFYGNKSWPDFVVPGNRYTSSGSCVNPVSIMAYPVTVTGSAGTTVAGPTITIDDSCSFQGFYGTVNYTGNKGTLGVCRLIYIQTYSDSGYTTLAQPIGSVSTNGANYNVITNCYAGGTGLTPVYVKAFFDANGNALFDAGDPYIDLGPVTPTTDGLLLNISFGDDNIK